MTHNIKIHPVFVEPILEGEKRFEIRYNDRGYQKGDYVKFEVYPNAISEIAKYHLTEDDICDLETMTFKITYVINGWGLKNGFVAFGLKRVTVS